MTQSRTALLRRLIDYAGLFPPAALPMETTVANYGRDLASSESWMLGRLIVPVARFAEFEIAVDGLGRAANGPWQISALTGTDLRSDIDEIVSFNERNSGRAIIDAIETKVATSEGIAAAAAMIPHDIETFFELPVVVDPDILVAAVAAAGRRAKIRTGGITQDAFPPADQIVRFIARCAARGVAFKATAGLHHPLRCVRPLTYEPESASGTMHGFLNVFLAATLIHRGGDVALAETLLADGDPGSFRFAEDAVSWRDEELATCEIESCRTRLALSFGSCSFDEPVGELAELA